MVPFSDPTPQGNHYEQFIVFPTRIVLDVCKSYTDTYICKCVLMHTQICVLYMFYKMEALCVGFKLTIFFLHSTMCMGIFHVITDISLILFRVG